MRVRPSWKLIAVSGLVVFAGGIIIPALGSNQLSLALLRNLLAKALPLWGVASGTILGMDLLLLVYKQFRLSATQRPVSRRPPCHAEYLFYLFLSPHDCDALVGDLEERYRLIRRKFGKRRADFWYWVQVVASLRPVIWAAVKRVSGLVALVEAWRRIRH